MGGTDGDLLFAIAGNRDYIVLSKDQVRVLLSQLKDWEDTYPPESTPPISTGHILRDE